jgi:phage protein D
MARVMCAYQARPSSAEIVALRAGPGAVRPAASVAVTNHSRGALATVAALVITLHSGVAASVSTKSYLNTLAAHQRLTAALTNEAADDVLSTAQIIDEFAKAALRAALGAGAQPGASLVRRSSLEDVFLRLTGRTLVE